jgi:hypothetical protein
MARRTTKHFERVAGIRNDIAKLSPERWPNRIADDPALADELEALYRSMGLWKKACGQFCECKSVPLKSS